VNRLKFTLPYPPSVNRYWRHIVMGDKPRTIISRKGREYRATVICQLANLVGVPAAHPIRLGCRVFLPDRRRRDIDNILKALLDSMQHAGMYKDDNQITELNVWKPAVKKPGSVDITLTWPWKEVGSPFWEGEGDDS